MAIEPLESLTRICLSRQLTPFTWLRLFKEAKMREAPSLQSKGAESTDYNAEAIDTLLPLLRASNTSLAQTYLQACLSSDIVRRYLLITLLEQSEEEDTSNSDGQAAFGTFYESVASTLLGNDTAFLPRIILASSRDEGVKITRRALILLAVAAQSQASSLFVLMLQILQTPLPETGAVDEDNKAALVTALRSTKTALTAVTNTTVNLPYPYELAHQQLDGLERTFDVASYRRRTVSRPVTFPSMPLEMEILIQYTLYDNCRSALSDLLGSLRARLALQDVLSESPDIRTRQLVFQEWATDLFECCSKHVNVDEEPKSRSEAKWRAFTYGRLPSLLREVGSSQLNLEWLSGGDLALRRCGQRQQVMQTDWTDWAKIMKRALEAPPKDFSKRVHMASADSVLAALQDCLEDYASHASAAVFLRNQLASWASSSDLHSLHNFLLALIRESPRIVDFLLLHISPVDFFKPLIIILDEWDSSDEYGAGQAMEIYGGILLSIRTLVQRHGLQDQMAQMQLGIVNLLLDTSTGLSTPQTLQSLSEEHKRLVGDWITALYGSEGIEDDLIRSTYPRTMLLLAPTIVHQSLKAMETGIIDQDSLVNGLSYFCQDFLIFTLPGIISYLASSSQPNIQIIKSLLTSESTPACVWELAQYDLQTMLHRVGNPDEDALMLSKKLKTVPAMYQLGQRSFQLAMSNGYELPHNLFAAIISRRSREALKIAMQSTEPLTASLIVTLGNEAALDRFMQDIRTISSQSQAKYQISIDGMADCIGLAFVRSDVLTGSDLLRAVPLQLQARVSSWLNP